MFDRLQPRRGQLTLSVALLAGVLFLMLGLRECSAPGLPPRADDTAKGDTINVAIEMSPMGVSLSGDTLSGVYYDMVRELCGRHGVNVRFHPFTLLSTALDKLADGRYQMVVSDIPATAEMKQRFIFTEPVEVDRLVLAQLADSAGDIPFKSQVELAGKEIFVPKGTPSITRLKSLGREIGDTIIIRQDSLYSSEQLLILVANGERPNAAVSMAVARRMRERYPMLDLSLGLSFNQFHSWALNPKDSVLRDSLSVWIKELNRKSSFQQ